LIVATCPVVGGCQILIEDKYMAMFSNEKTKKKGRMYSLALTLTLYHLSTSYSAGPVRYNV